MIARSRISVVAEGGRSTIRSLVAEAPLLIRPTTADDGVVEVHLVGGAAGPLAGDDLGLEIDVGEGAALRVRAVAASYALPGRSAEPSRACIVATVGSGGWLDWWPSPTVSVRSSDHHIDVSVRLQGDARLRWVDEVVLGRHREPPGHLVVAHRIEHDGVAVLVQRSCFGGPASPGVHGGARVIATAVVHGEASSAGAAIVDGRGHAARSPLTPRTTSWVALAAEHPDAESMLGDLGLVAGQTV